MELRPLFCDKRKIRVSVFSPENKINSLASSVPRTESAYFGTSSLRKLDQGPGLTFYGYNLFQFYRLALVNVRNADLH